VVENMMRSCEEVCYMPLFKIIFMGNRYRYIRCF
jgi:hypothetical protein